MCCFFVITTIIEIVYYNGQNKKKAFRLIFSIKRAMNTKLNTSFFIDRN